ncbi:His-Xaa-Ser system radical SAM maturase HxsB [Rubrivivax gelatinosus]|uniref:His-Xaa-Ser system radical SAM maturase HxsB n=2 Tax=Rubrivivax gelatinosus TaxID=28068 RepID=A0ABS1DZX6_RUBGE|nr:His-Xaa-Ser system radical SAM maturase HxsB [Rubrivivax gelatinosus]MBK1714919.1 His-Xaa-Ser system radical SAM maturase HxsB [Rubrivivax gelatinosus]
MPKPTPTARREHHGASAVLPVVSSAFVVSNENYYASEFSPVAVRQLGAARFLAVSRTGDHHLLSGAELQAVERDPASLPLPLQATLKSRFLLLAKAPSPGLQRLARSLLAAKRETVQAGPSLHILVTTLHCEHSCGYCQVSRAREGAGFTMAERDLDAACDTVFESASPTLTIEFQGGDPLLRPDLVERAVRRIHDRNRGEGRRLRFVVASTLHQLDAGLCDFLREHDVFLSTSIDGPAWLHDKNRPTPGRDSYRRTVAGIRMARERIHPDCVSALMTTTPHSLPHPEAIVDEYVQLGLQDVFLRPLSAYGFAKRNQARLGYSLDCFDAFYQRGLDRVIEWNRRGVPIREVYAGILLNKMLSPFDSGFVDLQSPCGAGSSVLVYNHDGHVYPSDEARMLAATGDPSLRLGRIGEPLSTLLSSRVQRGLHAASLTAAHPDCQRCAYQLYCAPNPVEACAAHGRPDVPPSTTEHCQRHQRLFDSMFRRLDEADPALLDLFHRWAHPHELEASPCAA